MEALGFPREVFRFWSPEEVEALLREAGFGNVEVRRPADASITWVYVVASETSR
jgi:hypothetical protein